MLRFKKLLIFNYVQVKIHPLFIPSTPPVLVGDIMSNINTSLEKLSKIDDVFEKVIQLVNTVNDYLSSGEVANFIKETSKISKNVADMTEKFNRVFPSEKLDSMSNDVYVILKQLKVLSKNLNSDIAKADLPKTVSDIKGVLNAANTRINDLTNNFEEALESLRELSTFLNQHPNSIIWGKNNKKVVPTT